MPSMPVIAQASKKLRHDAVRTRQTTLVREAVRSAVKAARKSPTKKTLTQAFRSLDKAAKHNIIHKNKAARLKSRLSKLLKK